MAMSNWQNCPRSGIIIGISIGSSPPRLREIPPTKMNHPDAKIRHGAFTLLELLVVIAIIGILAAVIMTAGSNSKNSASKATDINNLKQIMVTLNIYTSDDGDVLPRANWDNGGFGNSQGTNTGWLYAVDLSATGTDRFKVNTGLFWPTLQNPKIYFCPMDNNPGGTRYSASRGVEMQRPQQISSY